VRLFIASLKSLADRIRQAFGKAGAQATVSKAEFDPGSGAGLLRRKRFKVAAIAIVLGTVSGLIELPLPAEDAYRVARASLRVRPAPQDIVLIALDEKTLNNLGKGLPSRVDDSALMDRLVAAGVEQIVWDRAHADPQTPEADKQFASTLERYKGRVWLGMIPQTARTFQKVEQILPDEQFRPHAQAASMMFEASPFRLGARIPTEVETSGARYPAIAAVLSGYDGPAVRFRPDLAIDPRTFPTYSYFDVLRGTVGAAELKGKRVIIGEAYLLSTDVFEHPVYGRFPGATLHIAGAHTLKRGAPLDLAWYPALLVVCGAILWQAFRRTRSSRPLLVSGICLVAIPFVLDETPVSMDIMSGLLALGAAGFGYHRIAKKYYSGDVDAMTTSALSLDRANSGRDVYALKISNLSEISEDWSERELGEFVKSLIAYVKEPGEVADIAFERDVLVWFAPRMDAVSLERHADGLALMLKTAISYDWQSANSAPALGIDINYALPIGQRIKKAMQAADEAAARGVRFIINDAAHLEARNHRLEMIRLLEKGLRERNIGVAYQPKVDLASGRIVGAETLIRWRPEGGELVNPQDLVLAAEAGDRINELTLVVMERALLEAKQAIALDPRFKLAVNMSAKSLSDTHLLFDIMTLLGRYDFPAENLTLELTETAKLEDHRIAPQIAALKARGIGLSIDDFGTGESNLEYIEKLPSSELKIDKRFVQHMATSEESRAVVRATIEIAHSLGKTVVAEGVEDETTAGELRAMGCDQAQGYLFSQAIGMVELLAMMGGRPIALNV
jgi:EAL domain-containing protein (putative c-di-GMP-specific phosphodiesterase class I)/CHASE2 domain-containing sensor protein